MPTQWAVVADDSRARIFARVATHGSWQDIDNLARRHLEPASDGREQRLPPMSRQLLASSDIQRGGERSFASLVAERLVAARKRGDFDQLMLVAPPSMLAELRRHLDSATLRKLVTDIEADMAGLPVKTTQRELARML